jgi:hypothetical protein
MTRPAGLILDYGNVLTRAQDQTSNSGPEVMARVREYWPLDARFFSESPASATLPALFPALPKG